MLILFTCKLEMCSRLRICHQALCLVRCKYLNSPACTGERYNLQKHFKASERDWQFCFCKLLQTYWHFKQTNVSILSEANILSDIAMVMLDHRQWEGHIVCMSETGLPNKSKEGSQTKMLHVHSLPTCCLTCEFLYHFVFCLIFQHLNICSFVFPNQTFSFESHHGNSIPGGQRKRFRDIRKTYWRNIASSLTLENPWPNAQQKYDYIWASGSAT